MLKQRRSSRLRPWRPDLPITQLAKRKLLTKKKYFSEKEFTKLSMKYVFYFLAGYNTSSPG